MSVDADPLPGTFTALARTCERCGKTVDDARKLTDGECGSCLLDVGVEG